MSFVFPSWETAFSPDFYDSAKAMLETALNKGNKPPVIHGHIEVVELSMGTQPPTLTLLEIGDLSLDRFRGILRLGYQGDAWLEVRCRVQANPLSHNPNLATSSTLPLSMPLLASQPLLVPMTLRLSKLHLRAILILVVSASKGITLVFKNDPLQNVDVSSTFDSVEVIRGYLQQEIEGQLREMFREDLPGIIHRLSQRWFTGTGVGGRVEMPYRESVDVSAGTGMGISTPGKQIPGSGSASEEDLDPSDPYAEKPIFPPYKPAPSISQLTPKRRALAQQATRLRRLSTAVSESPSAYTTFPDIEDYDPTYGLRPEGVPTHSGYEGFGRLWEKSGSVGKGLGSLMQVPVGTGDREGDVSDLEEEEEDDGSVEVVERDEVLRSMERDKLAHPSARLGPGLSRRNSGRSRAVSNVDDQLIEWETFPAVGGGHITRPRVFHAQSQIRAPSEAGGGAVPSPSATNGAGSVTARAASSVGGASSTIGSLRRQPITPIHPGLRPGHVSHHSVHGGVGVAGPGPSSLRRMVTSRSDVFLSRTANTNPSRLPNSASHRTLASGGMTSQNSSARRQSTVPSHQSQNSSRNRQSGSSWSRSSGEKGERVTRSSTYATMPTSTFPSTGSISIPSPPGKSANNPFAMDKSPSKSNHLRNPSISGLGVSPPTSSFPPRHSIIGPAGITLPLNNSVSQLAALSNSAHTLSPYARGHEHIAVRSFPHLGRQQVGEATQVLDPGSGLKVGEGKGNRKRLFRLNTKKEVPQGRGDVDTPPMMSPRIERAEHGDGQRSLYSSSAIDERNLRGIRKGLRGMSLSDSDHSFASGGHQHATLPQSTSFTGMAKHLMSDTNRPTGNAQVRGLGLNGIANPRTQPVVFRPNLMRSPDSRSSYGFPTGRQVA